MSSVLVPKGSPGLRIDTLASQRSEPFFHVDVGDAQLLHQAAQLREVGPGLLGRADVGLADDLHQGSAAPVEVHQRVVGPVDAARGPAGVHQLARVFFHVHPGDAHPEGAAVLQFHVQMPADAQRQVVLRDLVGLGQVGIEVVLAVEDGALGDPAVEGQGDARGVLHRLLVDHRQHARMPQADRADPRVGRLAEGHLAAAEHLGAGAQLHVDLEADDRLPAAVHRRPPRPRRRLAERRSRALPDAPARSGATTSTFSFCSTAWAASSRPRSEKCGPMSCRPTGRPAEKPAGMLMPGSAARFTGMVQRSERYMASGSAVRSPDLEGHRGRRGRDEKVEAAEGLLEVLDDERAGPLGLSVVGVVVAGRERVGADHDAALDLGTEALAAGAHVHLVEVLALGGAVPVADPVEAGQVGAGLRGRDEVVGGDAALHAGQAHLFAHAAQSLDGLHRRGEHLAHPGLAGLAQVLLDDARTAAP